MSTRRIRSVFGKLHVPALAFTLAVGLLIWMKLRLVTGATRTVYAEPKPQVLTPLMKNGLRDHPPGESEGALAPRSEAAAEFVAEDHPDTADR